MKDLNVALVQSALSWESPEENFRAFEKQLNAIDQTVDLIVLPEMFNTGFSMASKKLAEPMDGPSVGWLKRSAAEKQAVIITSLIITEEGKYYNRLLATYPDGKCYSYDKRHLFRMAEEHHHFAPGRQRLLINVNGWIICPLICYDLRFPMWSRNVELSAQINKVKEPLYDVLIYVANWPEARRKAWSALLLARAHENQAYVIASNRVGKDGKNISYSGDSVVISPKGDICAETYEHQEQVVLTRLVYADLSSFRSKFPVSLDADEINLFTDI